MATQACPLVPGARAIACNDIAGPGLLGQTELLEFAAIPIYPCNSSSQAAHAKASLSSLLAGSVVFNRARTSRQAVSIGLRSSAANMEFGHKVRMPWSNFHCFPTTTTHLRTPMVQYIV